MPDIAMCKGGSCSLRLNCYRYTAKAEEMGQSYLSDPPYKMNMMLDDNEKSLGVVTTSCAYFWNNVEYKKNEKPTN
jgi:hypothetical protein